MPNKDDHKMRCSFCGKPQDMVYKLITGPGVCICDECVELCNSILYDEDVECLLQSKHGADDVLYVLLLVIGGYDNDTVALLHIGIDFTLSFV